MYEYISLMFIRLRCECSCDGRDHVDTAREAVDIAKLTVRPVYVTYKRVSKVSIYYYSDTS